MARALLVVQRRPGGKDAIEHRLEALNRLLTPDNIEPRPPSFAYSHGVSAAVFSPSSAVHMHGTSIAVGALLSSVPDWYRPGATIPEGSFALLRVDADRVELVADEAGSRTIWYAMLEDKLIASTSQRAIVALLGSFKLNRDVLPWVLSSGTLGGAGAWDARLVQLGRGERLTLDRASWTIARTRPAIEFEPDPSINARGHVARLAEIVERLCGAWRFDAEKWALPLSGGTDSRGLLSLLHDRPGLQTITWGTAEARYERGNDAQIAADLARAFGVANRFFPTDFSAEPRERLVQRFLAAGEGRVAQISGYLDGFKVWKTLYEDGVEGIIRGDEAFGSMYIRDEYGARYTANLTLLSDYFGPNERAAFELPEQPLQPEFAQRDTETLDTWRDRLYQEFRIPNLLAALTDLKTAYVEVANPLLTRAVLECARRLSDDLRTSKRAWREIVRARGPAIPYARSPAVLSLKDFVSDTSMLQLMLGEMESANAAEIFSPALRETVTASIKEFLTSVPTERKRISARAWLMRSLPQRVRLVVRRWATLKPELHPMVFAFRAFVASRMNGLMKADARALLPKFGHALNRRHAVNL
jgi:hypothetical protein